MTKKNLYDVLGLSVTASPEQVRQAFLLRSKLLHPDRFDQTKQSEEWSLANEMFKELNYAYGILRDPAARAEYDRSTGNPFAQATAEPPPRRAAEPPPRRRRSPPRPATPPGYQLGRLRAGVGRFEFLPPSTRERLLRRVSGENQMQYAVKLADPRWRYAGALLVLGWLSIPFLAARGPHWSLSAVIILLALTVGAACLLAWALDWILRWRDTPLGCWLLVTPLYVVKTYLGHVWYWPVWEVSNVSASHRFLSGSYHGTDLRMEFGAERRDFRIAPQTAFDSLMATLRRFEQRAKSARADQDWRYFYEEDDFREFVPGTALEHLAPPQRFRRLLTVSLALYVASFGFAWAMNSYTESADKALVAAVPFDAPKKPLPPNGELQTFTEDRRSAPLEINGAYGDNYLVKLCALNTDEKILTVFVRGGQSVTVYAPVGSYRLKYAAGDTWYGDRYLFGPETIYNRASEIYRFRDDGGKVIGYSTTLYKVTHGNLRTDVISADGF